MGAGDTDGGGPLGKRGERTPGHGRRRRRRSQGEGRETKKKEGSLGRGRTGSSEVSSPSLAKPPPTVPAVLCCGVNEEMWHHLAPGSTGTPSVVFIISFGWIIPAFTSKIDLFYFRLLLFSCSCYFSINSILHLQYLTSVLA